MLAETSFKYQPKGLATSGCKHLYRARNKSTVMRMSQPTHRDFNRLVKMAMEKQILDIP